MRTSPLGHSGVDHTVLPANTPHLPLLRSLPLLGGGRAELGVFNSNTVNKDRIR